MDYLKHYWNLIRTRRGLTRSGYLEEHHIVPKSVFYSGLLPVDNLSDIDDPKNIIKLTGREHFVAHWLLHRAFPESRNLAAGFFAMANLPGHTKRRFTPSSRAVAEAREAYSIAQSKAVARYSLEGILLEVHDTTNEAADLFKTNPSNISAACNTDNGTNNVAGFMWRRFEDEPLAEIEPYVNQNEENSKQVHQYDYKGNYVQSFDSLRQANREGALNREAIDGESSEVQFSEGSFFLVSSSEAQRKIKIKRKKTQRRRVAQIHPLTGETIRIWDSSRQPGTELGIMHVSLVCNGKRKTAGGFIWRWAYDESPLHLKHYKRKKPRARTFELFKDGKSQGIFDSMREAEKVTGVRRYIIAKAKNRGEHEGITVKLL